MNKVPGEIKMNLEDDTISIDITGNIPMGKFELMIRKLRWAYFSYNGKKARDKMKEERLLAEQRKEFAEAKATNEEKENGGEETRDEETVS